MRQSILRSVLAVAAMTLPLIRCGSSPHAPEERYVFVATNTKLPYWQSAFAGLRRAALQLQVRAELVGPETYDPAGQIQEFRRVVQQKPSGILVSPADPQKMGPEIDAAIAQGIPVITVDSDAPNSKRLLFVGTNNYQAGVTGGEVAAKQLDGKGNVVVFTMPEQLNLAERLNGYKAVFDRHPGLKIAEVIDIKGDPRVAFDKTSEIVSKRIGQVDGFVCLEALAGKEVAEVLDRHKVTGKVIVAMDTDEGTLKWVKEGVIAASIAQKPYTMAMFGVKILDDLHHHKLNSLDQDWALDTFSPIPMFVDTGATLIDKNNLDQFLKARETATAPAQ